MLKIHITKSRNTIFALLASVALLVGYAAPLVVQTINPFRRLNTSLFLSTKMDLA